MRPVRLVMSGLRSYRARTEIDFNGIGLLAIVGDTGAGKSSILEAITYALYNGSTWSQRDVRSLIADGAQTMFSELDFVAEGRTYRIFRSTSRGNYPPPVHKLECLSDPAITRLDREDSVNLEVERLVGMDYKGFLSAVILPQGRFQGLLMATPGERTKILKGIFRLDEIELVRERADQAVREARPLLLERQRERGLYRPNPAQVAEQARQDAERAGNEEASMRELQKQVKTLLDAAKEARDKGLSIAEPLERLRKLPADSAPKLRALLPVAAEITAAQGLLDSELAELQEKESAAEDQLKAADQAGVGLDVLVGASSTLGQVERSLREVARRTAELNKEATAIEKEEVAVRALEGGLPKLEEEKLAADGAREAVEMEHSNAVEAWKRARTLLEEVRLGQEGVERATAALVPRRSSLAEKVDVGLPAARELVSGTERSHQEATQHLEHSVRSTAVARVAQNLHAGDDCPICARPLPKGYSAPAAPDEERVRSAVEEARTAYDKASRALTQLESEVAGEQRAIGLEVERIANLEADLEPKLAELRRALPDLDLGRSAEENLQPLVTAGLAVKGRVDAAKAVAAKANEDLVAARTRAVSDRGSLTARQEELLRKRTENQTEEQNCYAELSGMPTPYRPKAKAQTKDLEAIKVNLSGRIRELRQVAAELDAARNSIKAAEERGRGLARRWRTEVEDVRQRALRDLDAVRPRLNDCLGKLAREPYPDVVAQASLDDLLVWAEGLESGVAEAIADLGEELSACELKASGKESEAGTLLQKNECRLPAEVDEAIMAAGGRRMAAQKEEREARAEIAPAADLDRRIQIGEAFVTDMEELCRLLSDGNFVRHVIERRQRNLLAVASEILISMTGNRYGFSADFEVADKVSGQPRPTKTLSGGESFMASLALALGLVEMAARAGGKLDALFLDEGFGSLDYNSLDEAMSALERRAARGELVAVVSHIKAVAERIETVLRVTKTPLGSQARFVKGTERQNFMEDEVEAGLLH